ncbi:MAG: hypothetical protein K0Q90_59 [Paenibacillaceae bacterium]|jgi:hypothetical protein|nr:hypothetical protein [Paenibacillaceae bacterium]
MQFLLPLAECKFPLFGTLSQIEGDNGRGFTVIPLDSLD